MIYTIGVNSCAASLTHYLSRLVIPNTKFCPNPYLNLARMSRFSLQCTFHGHPPSNPQDNREVVWSRWIDIQCLHKVQKEIVLKGCIDESWQVVPMVKMRMVLEEWVRRDCRSPLVPSPGGHRLCICNYRYKKFKHKNFDCFRKFRFLWKSKLKQLY